MTGSLGVTGGLGLTATQLFGAISDRDLRAFLDPGILRVLDAIFGGRIEGDDLRRVSRALLDLGWILSDPVGRKNVLALVPEHKQAELEARLGRGVEIGRVQEWTRSEVGRMYEFFGLLEEEVVGPAPLASEPVVPDYSLFGHQRSAVRGLQSLLGRDERRAVLHLPTGAGKTRTAMHVVAESLRAHEPSVVVWLASGRELLEQAVEAFHVAWKHLGTRTVRIGSMWGSTVPDLDSFSDGFLAVGLAKAWAMMRGSDPGWAARLSRRAKLVVFDEAHQSVARTYRMITEELTVDYRCALLGLTATPGRTWADIDKDGELAEFFGGNKVTLDVPGTNPIEYLVEHGYLARPTFRTLFSEPGLALTRSEVQRIAGSLDIPRKIIASLSMSEQYVTAVLESICGLVANGHQRILVFAATVDHARVLTAVLAVRGVRSDVVTGATPTRVRDRAIRRFRADDEVPMVLVNFGVLTTGFDAPKASAVVIARPTTSLVLYSQMVGRGIRGPRAGGTESCTVVTVVDPRLPGFGDVAAAFSNWEDVWH